MRDSLLWTRRIVLIAVLLPAPYCACAQSAVSKQGQMSGALVEHPERLTGHWETPAGPDSVVGLDINLITKIPGAVTSLASVEQHEEHIYFSAYQRNGAELKGCNGRTQWNGKQLVMHFVPSTKDDRAIDIDLAYNEKLETWTGLFHCGIFSENVTLRRPTPGPNIKVSPLVGTWAGADIQDSGRCLHIVEQSDGAFSGWEDGLQMPGRACYANGLKPPAQSYETYGDWVNVLPTKDRSFSIELDAHSAGCCSHTVTGTLSADNMTLKAEWPQGVLQLSNSTIWRKIQGDSCRVLPKYRSQTALPRCPPGTVVKR
jgi:hypothetical protein